MRGSLNGRRHDGKPNRASWTIETKSMKEAEKKAAELEYEFKHRKRKSIFKKYSFNDLINEWRKSDSYQQISPKTFERYEGMLEHKLIPAFGVWPLKDIRPLDIMQFIASLRTPGARMDSKNQNPYSDKTIQGYYVIPHSLFDSAVQWEMASENVCNKVDKPSIRKHKAKLYEDEQIDRLLECLD